jgi:hypothetical protein
MRLETGTMRTFRFGLLAIAALAFSTAFAFANLSQARAQDDASADTASPPAAGGQSDQSAAMDPEQKAKADAAQQAHDAADAAEETLDSATEARDQLESDGAEQEQIDAANQAIAQARANKNAADAAAQQADDAMGQ